MNFKKNKALAIAATVAMALSVPSFAQLNNGDMEYGDGGWYLWNNPDGPAVAESQIAVQGLANRRLPCRGSVSMVPRAQRLS